MTLCQSRYTGYQIRELLACHSQFLRSFFERLSCMVCNWDLEAAAHPKMCGAWISFTASWPTAQVPSQLAICPAGSMCQRRICQSKDFEFSQKWLCKLVLTMAVSCMGCECLCTEMLWIRVNHLTLVFMFIVIVIFLYGHFYTSLCC